MRAHRAERIFAVLEHVVGDDEVERSVGNRRQGFAVIDNVDVDQRQRFEFGIVRTQHRLGQAVDIAHARAFRHRQGFVQRADFDAVTGKELAGQFAAVRKGFSLW